jgi:hypothetical protein
MGDFYPSRPSPRSPLRSTDRWVRSWKNPLSLLHIMGLFLHTRIPRICFQTTMAPPEGATSFNYSS